MAKFGCPPRFIAMVRQFHDGMQARVQNDGEFSEPFGVAGGVRQGCVLAPALFGMVFSAMLMDAFQDSDTGFPIRYRFNGNIFGLGGLQAKTRVQTDVLDELLYADDMDGGAGAEAGVQGAMDRVSRSCGGCGLAVGTKGTEVVHRPAPGGPYNEPAVAVGGQKLKVVDGFACLGGALSGAVRVGGGIAAGVAEAGVAFGRLRANVWERNGIKLGARLRVCGAVVLPALLYACETWTVYQRHAKRLNRFRLGCLGRLLGIKWQDKISDTEVLTKAGMQSMHAVLKLAQLGWAGRVVGVPDARLPRKVFCGGLREGKRSQGGQRGRYRDILRASLGGFGMPMGSWGRAARGRSGWRGLVNKGAALYEKGGVCEVEGGRGERKARAGVPPSDSVALACSACGRRFGAGVGLVSHQRTHQHTSALFKK